MAQLANVKVTQVAPTYPLVPLYVREATSFVSVPAHFRQESLRARTTLAFLFNRRRLIAVEFKLNERKVVQFSRNSAQLPLELDHGLGVDGLLRVTNLNQGWSAQPNELWFFDRSLDRAKELCSNFLLASHRWLSDNPDVEAELQAIYND